MGEKTPEELTDGEIFYDLDRFPKVNMVQERSQRGSKNGYLTMVKKLLYTYRLKQDLEKQGDLKDCFVLVTVTQL